MKLFRKRPLSLILCIMLCGFSFFITSDTMTALSVCAAALILIPVIVIFSKKEKRRKFFYCILLSFFVVSVLCTVLWNAFFYPADLHGKTAKITGYITESSHNNAYPSLTLRVSSINSESKSYFFLIRGSIDELSGINAGDNITFTGTVESLNHQDDNDEAYTSGYLVSRGISAVITVSSEIQINSRGNKDLTMLLDDARTHVSSRIKLLTDSRVGSFISALITGDRGDLDASDILSFRRIGISHILALSGMHLAILSAILLKFFKLLRLNKKVSVLLCSVLTLLYMAFTGFSPSVTRAGIMLITGSVLYLLSECRDGVTSLFLAVSLIVCISPHAVLDISLWLSAFATLGVLFFAEISREKSTDKKISLPKRILIYVKNGLVVSIFATTASLSVILISFGEFSLFSVFSTLIFSVLVEALIYLALLTLVFGGGTFFCDITKHLGYVILDMAENFASSEFALINLDLVPVRVFVVMLIVFFFAYLLLGERRHKRISLLVIIALFLSILVSGGASKAYVSSRHIVKFIPSYQQDGFLITDGGCNALICSSAEQKSAHLSNAILKSNSIDVLNKLIICTYTDTIVNYVNYLADSVLIDYVYLPTPKNINEFRIAETLSSHLSGERASLKFYKNHETIAVGEVAFTGAFALPLEENYTPMCAFTLDYRGNRAVYLTRGMCETDNYPALNAMYSADTVIVGACGKAYPKNFSVILENARRLIFGFEHKMTDYAKEYYEKAGIPCYVTEDSVILSCD